MVTATGTFTKPYSQVVDIGFSSKFYYSTENNKVIMFRREIDEIDTENYENVISWQAILFR